MHPLAVGLPLAPVSLQEVAQLQCLPQPTQAVSRLPPPTMPSAASMVQLSTKMYAMGQAANSPYQIPPCIHKEGDIKLT
jgi:hypothetical protein